MRIIWMLVLLFLVPYGYAEPIQCGGATFDVEYAPRNAAPGGWEQVKLTIAKNKKQIQKRYENVYFHIDCLKNPTNKPYIVWQAYCGGSSCRDLDNWGIVDPASLKIMIEPSDDNHEKAEKIFGGSLKQF